MTTKQMLEALLLSSNENCRRIAEKILSGYSTVAQEKKICGSFMKLVLSGKYKEAFIKADGHNKIAFLAYLLKERNLKTYTELVLSIDQLIKL